MFKIDLEANLSLEELREKIDLVDNKIVELLALRKELVLKVADKKLTIDRVRDSKREAMVLEKIAFLARQKDLEPKLIQKIYRLLMDYSVKIQKDKLQGEKDRIF